VALLVERTCGQRPLSLSHMWFGMANTTFDAALTDKSVIVRTNFDTEAFKPTCANLKVLGRLGLPVPRLLAKGVAANSTRPFAYMLLEKIPGRDLRFELPAMSRSQQSTLAQRVVDAQEVVAPIQSQGGFSKVDQAERHIIGLCSTVRGGILGA
jgi:aminoglycoside phosphotransferase (APT) family kinase protein